MYLIQSKHGYTRLGVSDFIMLIFALEQLKFEIAWHNCSSAIILMFQAVLVTQLKFLSTFNFLKKSLLCLSKLFYKFTKGKLLAYYKNIFTIHKNLFQIYYICFQRQLYYFQTLTVKNIHYFTYNFLINQCQNYYFSYTS